MAANPLINNPRDSHPTLHLDTLNQWIARLGMGTPLSSVEFYVLQRHPNFPRLSGALDYAVGMDQRAAKSARDFVAKILDESCTSARIRPPEMPLPAPSFQPPKTLGQFNSFIQRHRLGPLLAKKDADALKHRLGSDNLESLMQRIHCNDMASPDPSAELSAAIAAIVKLNTKEQQPAAPATEKFERPAPQGTTKTQQATDRTFATRQSDQPEYPSGASLQTEQTRHQARAYGKRFAMCAEIANTAGDIPTIKIEMAQAVPGKDRAYCWSEKLIFQLTRKELLIMAAVLLGMTGSCRFDNHGASKIKWFQMAMQDRGVLYLSMGDKGIKPMGVPVSEPDVKADLYVLTVSAIQRAYQVNDISMMIPFIRSQVASFVTPARE